MLFDLLDWLRRYPALSGPATHLSNVRFRGRRDLHGHHRHHQGAMISGRKSQKDIDLMGFQCCSGK
jgi:hypothetical protein